MITTSIPKYDAYVPGVRALSVAYMYIILVNQAIIQATTPQVQTDISEQCQHYLL